MFEPAVLTFTRTTTPVEVADAVGDVVRPRVVRSAGRDGKWGTRAGGITGLVDKATAGLVPTTLWSVIESTDLALRHGRKKVPLGKFVRSRLEVHMQSYSPTVAGSEAFDVK